MMSLLVAKRSTSKSKIFSAEEVNNMPPTDRVFKRCERDHIVGEVVHEQVSGAIISGLAVYEVSSVIAPPRLPILRGKVFGTSIGFKCTLCGATYNWYIGEDFLKAIFKKTRR
jgi:hypothetical protein